MDCKSTSHPSLYNGCVYRRRRTQFSAARPCATNRRLRIRAHCGLDDPIVVRTCCHHRKIDLGAGGPELTGAVSRARTPPGISCDTRAAADLRRVLSADPQPPLSRVTGDRLPSVQRGKSRLLSPIFFSFGRASARRRQSRNPTSRHRPRPLQPSTTASAPAQPRFATDFADFGISGRPCALSTDLDANCQNLPPPHR